jgi:predicted ATPase
VLALLTRMGAERPVVHVVEDLHWATAPRWTCSRSWQRTSATNGCCCCSPTAPTRSTATDPLSRWLAELGRLHRTERVVLDRLRDAEATELVTALTGQAPDPERLEDTLARSAGNPLFVEQLVLAGEQDGPLPATLHGLLESRVATLPEGTRRLLGAAAVIGRAASVPLLAGSSGTTSSPSRTT